MYEDPKIENGAAKISSDNTVVHRLPHNRDLITNQKKILVGVMLYNAVYFNL